MIFFYLIFSISFLLLFHSYVFYPFLLKILAKSKSNNEIIHTKIEEMPDIIILMAAYNEQKVIEEKLKSIVESNFPASKIKVFIGSDASTDNTDSIVEKFAKKYGNIELVRFSGRSGKCKIINDLYKKLHEKYDISYLENTILILTDANVFFHNDMITQLSKHFKNEKIGVVGANFFNTGLKDKGISHQEKMYINRENELKYNEGKLWGKMIGAFGGCYAIQYKAYNIVPDNFLMEDFYISMKIFEKNYLSIVEPEAICYEDVPNQIQEEFKRKTRISAGNFQNLSVLYHLLYKQSFILGFCFFSHKIIRWIGPFLIISMLFTASILSFWYDILFFKYITTLMLAFLSSYFIDNILQKQNINIKIFRLFGYFTAMNIALINGLIMYLKGIKSSVWTPTKREV